MKNIKLLLSLALLLSFAISTFAQKYKPHTKEIFFGDGSNWTPYTTGYFTYFNKGVDSTEEFVETWDVSLNSWVKSTVNNVTYLKDGRLKKELVSRYNNTLARYTLSGRTAIKYIEFNIGGTTVLKKAKYTASSWKQITKTWKETIVRETTFTSIGEKKETIEKQGFIGALQEVSKREFIYTSGKVTTIKYSLKDGSVWKNKTIAFTKYLAGKDLEDQKDEYSYTAGKKGNAINKTRFTYTSFDEPDSVIVYAYDTTAKTYAMSWFRVYSYDGNKNLLSEISHNVSSGKLTNNAKVIYSYNTTGQTEVVLKSSIKVFPNPAKGLVYIKSTEPILSIDIVDLRGRLVRSYTVSEEIDVSMLNRGVYIIKIQNTNGQISSKKLLLE